VCYAWLTLGLFWVGMPFTLRDQIAWVQKTPGRFRIMALAGLVCGAVLIIMSFTAWKGV
jgi:hypothetical protein